MSDETRKRMPTANALMKEALAYGDRCYSEGYQAGLEAAAKIAGEYSRDKDWPDDFSEGYNRGVRDVLAAIRAKAKEEKA